MARGWESKAVEEQQHQAQTVEHATTADEKDNLNRLRTEKLRKIQALSLTRARICEQIERTTQDRYKQLLDSELKHIDHELSTLEG